MLLLVTFGLLFGSILFFEWLDYQKSNKRLSFKLKKYAEFGGRPYCQKNMVGYKNSPLVFDNGILGMIQKLAEYFLPTPVEAYPQSDKDWEQQNEINKIALEAAERVTVEAFKGQ